MFALKTTFWKSLFLCVAGCASAPTVEQGDSDSDTDLALTEDTDVEVSLPLTPDGVFRIVQTNGIADDGMFDLEWLGDPMVFGNMIFDREADELDLLMFIQIEDFVAPLVEIVPITIDGNTLFISGGDDSVVVFDLTLSHNQIQMTHNTDHVADTTDDDEGGLHSFTLERYPENSGWTEGTWDIHRYSQGGETFIMGDCYPMNDGFRIQEIAFTIDNTHRFTQNVHETTYADSSCTDEVEVHSEQAQGLIDDEVNFVMGIYHLDDESDTDSTSQGSDDDDGTVLSWDVTQNDDGSITLSDYTCVPECDTDDNEIPDMITLVRQ